MQIKFGPSGNSQSFYDQGYTKTLQAPKWVSDLGLNAYELSFGRGINLSDQTAELLGKECQKYSVDISVHAPYYINFANPDGQVIQKNIDYLINSAKKLKILGGSRVVFHSASVGKVTRENALKTTYDNFLKLTERIYSENLDGLCFCPETMGKINQIGTVEEVVNFCTIDKVFLPTIDFGHIYARSHGEIQGEKCYEDIVLHILDKLGDRAKQLHIHFSKIMYSQGGEVKHLTFDDTTYGPDFLPLAKIIKKYSLAPTVICESAGTQAEDAVEMSNIFKSIT